MNDNIALHLWSLGLRNSSEERVRNQRDGLLKEIGGLKIERILWEGEAHQRRGRRQTERGPLGQVYRGMQKKERRPPTAASISNFP